MATGIMLAGNRETNYHPQVVARPSHLGPTEALKSKYLTLASSVLDVYLEC